MTLARYQAERGGAGDTAPAPNVARFASKAIPPYPVAGIGSTDYAARIIGARCRLSPAVARKVVELVGIGSAA
jgi:hypothetical protein